MPVNQAMMTQGGRPFAKAAWMSLSSWKNKTWIRSGFALAAAACDSCAIAIGVLAAELLTHLSKQDLSAAQPLHQFGLLVAIVFLATNIRRGDYAYEQYHAFKPQLQRSISAWCLAIASALTMAFLMKTTTDLSRLSACLFFGSGAAALAFARFLLVQGVKVSAGRGGAAARRVLLLGCEEQIDGFYARCDPCASGMRIVAASVLRGADSLDEDLALAAASARIFRPEDVFILVPRADKETVDRCVDAFLRIPAAIHLGSDCVLDRFAKARIATVGPIASLTLARPLAPAHVAAKRVFDIAAAFSALVILAPLFAALALAIKLDSKGPVIFRQRRYGFNQEPFRIFKFRSMSALEDGRKVRQATAHDARVTKIGRFMRRTNLDELPQLLNVLLGDMSLVGPRPHALAHDQMFEPSVALYARRHNVKPGITGWAQVHGLRGEVTEASLKARIEHDLYYIDHSSLWLDLQILWRTLASRKAFKNAY